MSYEHLNKSGVLWLITKIKNGLAEKVDKVDGKSLSTNDYTTSDKNKLSGIAEGAEANVQSDWNESTSTSDAFIKNKPTSLPADGGNADTIGGFTVEVNVPANAKFTDTTYEVATNTKDGLMSSEDFVKLSAFGTASDYSTTKETETLITNKGYQTAAQVQSLINSSLSDVTGIDIQVVSSLPTTGTKGIIYLVLHSHTDSGDNYDEYIWVESASEFEKIGNTDIDLSGYMKTSDIVDITEDELTAMWNS